MQACTCTNAQELTLSAGEPTISKSATINRSQGLPEPTAYPIAEVTSEILPGANGEDYIRTTVILEDGHPELDGRALNKFTLHIAPLCTERGFKRPTIVYAHIPHMAKKLSQ